MQNKKSIILQSSLGSVFTTFSEEELKKITNENKRTIAICGKINNPGVVEVPEGATLVDVINLAGGLLNDRDFKAAQLGIPFGGFLTDDDLSKELDFKLFDEGTTRSIIILTQEDCIVQYVKFYIDYLIGKIKDKSYQNYTKVYKEIIKMWKIMDRISKGRANMREMYFLRDLSKIVKEKMNQRYNIIEEIIDKFYDEIEEHIYENKCYALQCNHLVKLTITD